MPRSAYKIEDKFEEQERDVKKFWKRGQIRLAIFGLENQTGEDPDYIFRDFGYEGADYRDQVRRRNEVRRKNALAVKQEGTKAKLEPLPDFYPVITLVLYFGDARWKKSVHLKDHMKIPEGLEQYVSDYRANVFEIAFLEDGQVQRFTSDFRYVAEYFVANRMVKEGKKPQYTITLEHLKHVEEFAELMNAITNSDRFSQIPKIAKERGDKNMYTLMFDEAEERGEAKGKIKGAISTYYEDYHLSPMEIIQKIIGKFSLDEKDARNYVEETLGVTLDSSAPTMAESAVAYDPGKT